MQEAEKFARTTRHTFSEQSALRRMLDGFKSLRRSGDGSGGGRGGEVGGVAASPPLLLPPQRLLLPRLWMVFAEWMYFSATSI